MGATPVSAYRCNLEQGVGRLSCTGDLSLPRNAGRKKGFENHSPDLDTDRGRLVRPRGERPLHQRELFAPGRWQTSPRNSTPSRLSGPTDPLPLGGASRRHQICPASRQCPKLYSSVTYRRTACPTHSAAPSPDALRQETLQRVEAPKDLARGWERQWCHSQRGRRRCIRLCNRLLHCSLRGFDGSPHL